MRTDLLAGLTLCAMSLSAAPCWADETNPAMAEALFREGQRLLAENAVAEACGKLAESMKLDPTTGTLMNLALCHEKQGKLARAWAEMSQAGAQSRHAGNKEREAFARDKVAALERRLAHARLAIAASAGVTELSVDGQAVGVAAWTTPLPLDPGEHVFVFTGVGRRRTLNVRFVEGATQEVALTSLDGGDVVAAPPAPAAPSAAPPGATPLAADGSSGPSMRSIGLIVGGVGIAGAVVGSIFGLRALSAKRDVDDHCTEAICDAKGLAAADDARSDATIATIGFGVGVAGLAAGAILILVSPRSAPRVGPNAAAGARGLQIGGSF